MLLNRSRKIQRLARTQESEDEMRDRALGKNTLGLITPRRGVQSIWSLILNWCLFTMKYSNSTTTRPKHQEARLGLLASANNPVGAHLSHTYVVYGESLHICTTLGLTLRLPCSPSSLVTAFNLQVILGF